MTLKAFASLRFAGETLEPSQVGDILRVQPTLSYHKGEIFPVGRSQRERVGRTGLWLLNTEGRADPHRLDDHIALLTEIIFLDSTGQPDPNKTMLLRTLVVEQSLDMRISLFWHGNYLDREPNIRADLYDRIKTVGGHIEKDFEKENRPSKKMHIA